MSFVQPVDRRGKSQLRKDIESLNVGQSALFRNAGHDYKKFNQLYYAVHTTRKNLGYTLELKQLSSKDGAVVTRTA